MHPLPEDETLPSPNAELNRREHEEGHVWLSSTPREITLGTHNACNAKCVFCLEGRYSRFSLELYKEFFEAKLGHYLSRAETVTFTGFGELLWVPGIEEFLDHVNRSLPDARKIVTTNGTPLKPPVLERLLETEWVVQVSLHAADAASHGALTGLEGEFGAVLDNVRRLVELREAKRRRLGTRQGLSHPFVKLINVLTRANIDQLPELVRLAHELGVQQVRSFHLTMFAPEHIEQSCFFDQERANRAIRAAREMKARLERNDAERIFEVALPPLFGERAGLGSGTSRCSDPWQHLYVELQGSVQPCCFWGEHVADLKDPATPVETVWNGSFYRGLREAMAAGDPLPWCRNCVRYRAYNVDELLCHLTNRPEPQRRLLEEIRRRGLASA